MELGYSWLTLSLERTCSQLNDIETLFNTFMIAPVGKEWSYMGTIAVLLHVEIIYWLNL